MALPSGKAKDTVNRLTIRRWGRYGTVLIANGTLITNHANEVVSTMRERGEN